MDAAEKPAPFISDPMTWAEIRERYPDEWVCLVEVDWIHPHGLEFRKARVVGHGKTRRDPLDQAAAFNDRYQVIAHYFTGRIAVRPLRPQVILDDETRDAIRYRR